MTLADTLEKILFSKTVKFILYFTFMIFILKFLAIPVAVWAIGPELGRLIAVVWFGFMLGHFVRGLELEKGEK